MRRISPFLPFLFIFWIFSPQLVSAQEVTLTPVSAELPSPAALTPAAGEFLSPENGANLSGQVEISALAGSAWRLDFSYQEDLTGAWFPLAQSTEPVLSGPLSVWDTTSLTDGFYTLRLRVFAAEGTQDFTLKVRIRNYSPFETATPTLTLTPAATATFTPVPAATLTPTLAPAPSPTLRGPLPPNPATLAPQEIIQYLGKGILAVLVVFGFSGLAWWLRRR